MAAVSVKAVKSMALRSTTPCKRQLSASKPGAAFISHASYCIRQNTGPGSTLSGIVFDPSVHCNSSCLRSTFLHQKQQSQVALNAESCAKPGSLSRSQFTPVLLIKRGNLQGRPKRCSAVSKLAEGGRTTTNYASFPSKKSTIPPQGYRLRNEKAPPQIAYRWASFYLGLAATATGLLRSNAKLVLIASLMLAAYAMRSGMLNLLQGVPVSGADSKAGLANGEESGGSVNGVKAQAGVNGYQSAAVQGEPTAMEVVRPVSFLEEGLRPAVEAAKREVRQEVVAAGVVGRLERIMRMLPVIQEAALASRDLARQASGETAAALGVSTKINAEVVGLRRQVAAGLDALGRNLQSDVSEEVRKGSLAVANSIKEDLETMEERISKKVATSSEVLALHQRLDTVARLVEDVAHTTTQLQAIPLQVDALQQWLCERTLDPSELDLQRKELGAIGRVSQQLQGLKDSTKDATEALMQEVRSSTLAVERVAVWGAEISAEVRNLGPGLEESLERQGDENVRRLVETNQGLLDGVREAGELSVRAFEELRAQVGGLTTLQNKGQVNGELERVLAEGLAKIAAQLPGLVERGALQLGARDFSVDDEEEDEVDEALLEARRAYLSAYAPQNERETLAAGESSSTAVTETHTGARETLETATKELRKSAAAPDSLHSLDDEVALEGLWSNPLLTAVASQQSTFPGAKRLEVPKEVEEATQALFASVEEKLRLGVPADVAMTAAIDEAPPGTFMDASWMFAHDGEGRKQLGTGLIDWAEADSRGYSAEMKPDEEVMVALKGVAGDSPGNRRSDLEQEGGALEEFETAPRVSEGGDWPFEERAETERRASRQTSSPKNVGGLALDEGRESTFVARGRETFGTINRRSGHVRIPQAESEPELQTARLAGAERSGQEALNGGVALARKSEEGRFDGGVLEEDEIIDWYRNAGSERGDVTRGRAGAGREGADGSMEGADGSRGRSDVSREGDDVRNGAADAGGEGAAVSGEDFEGEEANASEAEMGRSGWARESDLHSFADRERRSEPFDRVRSGQTFYSREDPILIYPGEQQQSARVARSHPDLRLGAQLELESAPPETVLGLQSEREAELLTSAKSVADVSPGVSAALGSDWVEEPPDDNWGERRGQRAYSQRGTEGRGQGANERSSGEWDYEGEDSYDGVGGFEPSTERGYPTERETSRGVGRNWQERDGVNRPRGDYGGEYWEEEGANSPQRAGRQPEEDWGERFSAPAAPAYPEDRPEVPQAVAEWEEPLEGSLLSPRLQEQYEESVSRGERLLAEGRKGLSGQSEVVLADRMFSDAEKAFEEALSVAPDDRWALLQLASALLDHGELKHRLAERVAESAEGRFASTEEEEWLQAILDQGGDPADVITELREGSEELLKEAGRACRDALGRDPRDTEALTLWGLALCLRGQLASDRGNEEGSGDLRNEADELFQAGVEKFEAALAAEPELWTALLNWGFALRDRSRLRPISSVQRRKLLVEALDICTEVAERGKKGGPETLMARQELPVLESELDMVEEAVEASQPRRKAPASDQRSRRAGVDRWQDV